VTNVLSPSPIPTEAFTKASSAVDRLEEIYERNTAFLRSRFEGYVAGESLDRRVRACHDGDPCAHRLAAVVRFRLGARSARDDAHAA